MKTTLIILTVLMSMACVPSSPAAETNATIARIGIYDSRAVAYAWFWSDKHQSQLKQLIQSARAARSAGDTNRFNELTATLRQQQDEIHREGFSTAPPTEARGCVKTF